MGQTCRNNRIFRDASSSPVGVAGLYFRPRPFLLALLTIKVIKSVLFFRTFSCFLESPPRSRVLRASLRFLTISAGDRGRLKRGIFFIDFRDVADFWAERRLKSVPVRLRRQRRRLSWICYDFFLFWCSATDILSLQSWPAPCAPFQQLTLDRREDRKSIPLWRNK